MSNRSHPRVHVDHFCENLPWRPRWLLAAACFAAIQLAACGGGGSAGDAATPPAIAVASAPVLEPGSAATATVGAAGGSVSATASSGITYTLLVPPGALPADVAITLTPILDMGSAPLARSVLGAVQMEPSGLKFRFPATLRINAAPGLAAGENLVGFSSANDGSGFSLNLVRVEGASTLVNIMHFSTGGAAGATPAQLLPLVPLAPALANAEDAVAQLAELTARDAGLVQIVDVFRQWYIEIVKPALDAADGSTDVVFSVEAISAYKAWISTMDFIADSNSLELALAAELAESAPIAKRVFTALINSNLDGCASAAITMEARLASLSFASTLQGIAQSIGLAGAGSGLDRATFLLRANNCLRPVLDPITLPTGLKIGTGKSLDARAQVVVSGEPNPQAAPFFFTVSATGASLGHGSGNADAGGRFTTVFTPTETQMQFNVKACLVFQTGQPTSDICVQQEVTGLVQPTTATYSGLVSFSQPSSGSAFSGFLRVSIAVTGAVNTIKIVEANGNFNRTDGTDFFCPNSSKIAPLSFTYTTPSGSTALVEVQGHGAVIFFYAKRHVAAQNFVETSSNCEFITNESDDDQPAVVAAFPFITVLMENGLVKTIVLDRTVNDGAGIPANIYTGRLELDP